MAWDELANWKLVPEHLRPGLRAYAEHGQETGDFLSAVLRNDLAGAVFHADPVSLKALPEIVHFVNWHMPGGSYGDPESVKAWIARKGQEGDW